MFSRTHDRSSMTRLNESCQEHKCGKWRTREGSAYENALEYAYEWHLLIFSCICLCSTSSRKTAESVHPRLELVRVLLYFWMQLFIVPIARLAVNRSLGENAMKVLIKYRDFPFSPLSLFLYAFESLDQHLTYDRDNGAAIQLSFIKPAAYWKRNAEQKTIY